jgi:ATP phosphoribosyltransferase regulatory subunit
MDLHGGGEVLAQAAERLATAGPGVRAALRLVERLAAGVGERWPDLPLHFDLAELRGYHYHTGVVFSAYVPGHGRAVAQGGRYDDVGRVFGRARPATGFSADLKTLLSLAGRFAAAEGVARGVYAPCDPDPALATAVSNLRRQGERVIAALPGESGDASAHGCDRELVRRDGAWVLRSRDHD